MSWNLYILKLRLISPVHIGTFKITHFDPTRFYIPGKVIWGALTSIITRYFDSKDFVNFGQFLNSVIKFGYFYVSTKDKAEDQIFIPKYTEDGLQFGIGDYYLSETQFKSYFIHSQASIAINPLSRTAEDEMFHEMEFINHFKIKCMNNALIEEKKTFPVFLTGIIWIKEGQNSNYKLNISNNSLQFRKGCKKIDLLTDLKGLIQIGGERKYGFGRIEIEKLELLNTIPTPFSGSWKHEVDDQIIISLKKHDYIFAHVRYHEKLKIRGNIEPLVSRIWGEMGAGQKLVSQEFHWVPGSQLLDDYSFIVGDNGIWIFFD